MIPKGNGTNEGKKPGFDQGGEDLGKGNRVLALSFLLIPKEMGRTKEKNPVSVKGVKVKGKETGFLALKRNKVLF